MIIEGVAGYVEIMMAASWHKTLNQQSICKKIAVSYL